MFEIVFYKGTPKIPLLFAIFLRLHQVQMGVDLILHVVHIAGMRMTKSGIDGISIGNNMGGTMKILTGVESWLMSWRRKRLVRTNPRNWFEQKGDNIIWELQPAAEETEL